MSTTESSPADVTLGARYGRFWSSVPRELGFLLLSFPIALAGFVITLVLVSVGAGTVITFFVGMFLLIAAMYASRGFGSLELVRLQWAGRPPVTRPEWLDARAGEGFWAWLRSVFGNGHYWLYLLHTLVIAFAVGAVSSLLTVVTLAIGIGGLVTGMIRLVDRGGSSGWPFAEPSGAGSTILEGVLLILLGAFALVALPFVTRVLVLMHHSIARGVLGAFRSDALRREVIAANASRGAALSAEDRSLRRLERDIHDGPQQRLVRLQMDLATAQRQLESDPAKASATIAEAMQQSRDALEELRSLSRGFAPPILLDRGLVAALESAATRSPVPARVLSKLPDGEQLPPEISRNAYFVASESLTNAAKHSGARTIDVLVGSDATTLDISVTDDGVGGATMTPGHGLAGLEERLRGLGGVLTVTSPAGGPTVVAARFPIPRLS